MKKMKKILALVLALVLVFALCSCSSSGTPASSVPASGAPTSAKPGDSGDTFTANLKWAHQFSATHMYTTEFVQRFIDAINKATNGRVKITQYPANQLGATADYPNMMSAGTIQMCNIDTGTSVKEFAESGVWQLPGVFDKSATSTPALWEMYTTGSLKKELERNNMEIIGAYCIPGYIILGNSKPIATPADIKGTKVRVTGASRILAIQDLGASVVTLSSTDVSDALFKKTIDACVNSANASIQYGYQKVSAYATTGVNLGNFDGEFTISKKVWDTFPDNIKKLFLDTGYECSMHIAQLLDSQMSSDLATIGQSCKITNVSGDALKAWNDALTPVAGQWISSLPKDVDGKALIAERDALLKKYAK